MRVMDNMKLIDGELLTVVGGIDAGS